MPMVDEFSPPLNVAVLALDLCGILLLLLLILTPAPKHPLVNAFITACLLRSVSDILTPLGTQIQLQAFLNMQHQEPLLKFCVANTIITSYFTVVKAAFTVSFTLPSLLLAISEIEATKISNPHFSRLKSRHVLFLCIAPFIWALPVLFTPIRSLANGEYKRSKLSITSCYFKDETFHIASFILIIVPLAVAFITSMTIIFILWWWKGSVFSTKWWASLRSLRGGGRFASLVLAITLSAELYAAVIIRWFRERNRPTSEGLCIIIRVSIIWEAVTPIIFFFIFAAQPEIHTMWFEWMYGLIPFRFRSKPPTFVSVSAAAQGATVHTLSHLDQPRLSEPDLKPSAPLLPDVETPPEPPPRALNIMSNHRIQELGSTWNQPPQPRKTYIPTFGLHPPPSWSRTTTRVRVPAAGKDEETRRSRSHSHSHWQAASLTAVGPVRPHSVADPGRPTSFLDLDSDSGRVTPGTETMLSVGRSGRDSNSPTPAPLSQVSFAGSASTFG